MRIWPHGVAMVVVFCGACLATAGAMAAFATERNTDGRVLAALVFVLGLMMMGLALVFWPRKRSK